MNQSAIKDAMRALEKGEKITPLTIEILLSDIRQDRKQSRQEFNEMFDRVQTGENKTVIDWTKND